MDDDEYRVYMVPLPGDVRGAIREDCEGFASIYINDWLSPAARRKALDHELRHKLRDDLYNERTIEEVEAE